MATSKLSRIEFVFAFIAAIIYCVFVYFFIEKADYTKSWLLYTGNFIFMVVTGIYLFYLRRSQKQQYGMLGVIRIGEKQVIRSIILALIICIILLVILLPGKSMINKPANTIHDQSNGIDVMVIVNSIIGNIVTGSFVTVMLAASLSGRIKGNKNSV